MATSQPGGFSDVDVAAIEALLPLIGRVLELHALRRLSTMLLDAYVGHRSGARILAGRIRLGDVEAIDAVLWFSDLRARRRSPRASSQKNTSRHSTPISGQPPAPSWKQAARC